MKYSEDESIVRLAKYSKLEKFRCAKYMPWSFHYTCINSCSVSHKKHGTHQSKDQADFRVIGRNVKYFFSAYTLDIEVVSEPTKEHES
jgi:hypothetical protein